jgi:hypothetical protein
MYFLSIKSNECQLGVNIFSLGLEESDCLLLPLLCCEIPGKELVIADHTDQKPVFNICRHRRQN